MGSPNHPKQCDNVIADLLSFWKKKISDNARDDYF